jgi:hypothetical protein
VLWWEVSMIPWIMQRATNGRRRHSRRRSGATLLGRSSEGGRAHGRLIARHARSTSKQGSTTERQRARIPRGEGKRALERLPSRYDTVGERPPADNTCSLIPCCSLEASRCSLPPRQHGARFARKLQTTGCRLLGWGALRARAHGPPARLLGVAARG